MPAATTVAVYGGIDLHSSNSVLAMIGGQGEWLFQKRYPNELRGIRVHSKAELAERIQRYIGRINQDPVVYRWRYYMEEIAIA
ncbi:MAG: hypothetical protein J5I81_08460 [Nitrococcus mobilis]|nr:hypothetical protein [Nitrococcus mobilis]